MCQLLKKKHIYTLSICFVQLIVESFLKVIFQNLNSIIVIEKLKHLNTIYLSAFSLFWKSKKTCAIKDSLKPTK